MLLVGEFDLSLWSVFRDVGESGHQRFFASNVNCHRRPRDTWWVQEGLEFPIGACEG
jgi:hypothetical protein